MQANILAGRKAVEAHKKMHLKSWHKGIPEEHTPLLNTLLAKLEKCGFTSLDEFFATSESLDDGWQ